MEISVSLWSYVNLINEKVLDVVGVIRHMHSFDVKAVELLDCFLNTEETKQEVEKVIAELGMSVSSFSVSNNFTCNEETRLQQIQHCKDTILDAVRFNTKTVRIFAGNPTPDFTNEECMDLIIKSLKEVALFAEEHNVNICLENHGLLAGRADQVKSIVEAVGSKNLLLTTDTGNFLLVGEKSKDCIKTLKGLVGHVHFKDFKLIGEDEEGYVGLNGIKVKGVVIGEGECDMPAVIETLKETGYDGYLSMEFEGENTLENIEKSIKNIHEMIKNSK